MIRTYFLRALIIFPVVCNSVDSQAEGIERPAGEVINPDGSAHNTIRTENVKSKIVPILRPREKIAIVEKIEKPRSQLIDRSKQSRPLAETQKAQSNGPREIGASEAKSIKSKSSIASAPKRKSSLKIANGDLPSNQGMSPDSSDDPWDSASKRFDQNDPAASVTQGVRVEDIIEATSDYKYSSARKKNPFIPAVVMGRAMQQQKDLNPNDVEIPIINPLQSFKVDQLSVIGVWESDDGIWKALIQTPTNQGIETKLGDPAGNSGGRIMSITPDAVVVREFSIRGDGTREYRDIPVYMGSNRTDTDTSNIGGRLILRPGSATPEIEPPSGGSIKPVPSASLAPTEESGTLKTIVPSAEIRSPNELYSPVEAENGGRVAPILKQSVVPVGTPTGTLPESMSNMDGGSK